MQLPSLHFPFPVQSLGQNITLQEFPPIVELKHSQLLNGKFVSNVPEHYFLL